MKNLDYEILVSPMDKILRSSCDKIFLSIIVQQC